MEEKKFTADESLALISSMIQQTRNRMVRQSKPTLLVWGYVTVLVTAAVFIALWQTGDSRYNWLWLTIPLLGWVTMRLTQRRSKPTQGEAHTFVDRVIGIVWAVMGFSVLFVSLVSGFGVWFGVGMPILFIVLLMLGVGTAITGLVIRFTPVSIGGIFGILFAPILLIAGGYWQFVIFAAGFVVMMIIPGHILRYKTKKEAKPCSDR